MARQNPASGNEEARTPRQDAQPPVEGGALVPFEEPAKPAPRSRRSRTGRGQTSGGRTNLPAPVTGSSALAPDDGRARRIPLDFPERERRSFLGRLLLLLAMVAVIVASILIFMFRPSEYDERTNSVNFLYNSEKNVSVVVVNGTVRGEVSGVLSTKVYNDDGRICAALVEDRLYLIQGKKITEIAAGVTDFELSVNGKALAYRTQDQVLYYVILGKKDGVSRISGSTTDRHYCLSPDGKELFYTYERDGVLRVDVYSRTASKPYLAENEDLYPVAIADDCRYLYYTNAKGELCLLIAKTGDRVICGDAPRMETVTFNRDVSEMMFRNGEEIRLYANGKRLILPAIAATDSLALKANRRVAHRSLYKGTQYLLESLCDNYYLHYSGTAVKLVYLDRKGDKGEITDVSFVDSAESVTVTDRAVYFLKTSEGAAVHTDLYSCGSGKTAVTQVYWDVTRYCTNVDGSRMLFVDIHGALFSYRPGTLSERISDTVVEESLTVTADDVFYYYVEEGKLWVSDNGDAPRAVREGVQGFMVDGYTLYYVTDIAENGSGTIYANYRNSRKDTQIATGVAGIG